MPAVVLAGELPDAGGGLAWAAAVAVALARGGDVAPIAGDDGAVVLVEVGSGRARGPTMLAADAARELERDLREAGFEAAARGRLAWVRLEAEDGWIDRLRAVIDLCRGARTAVVCLSPADLRGALGDQRLGVAGVLLRAELPRQRPLAALAARELLAAGLRTRIVTKPAGRVASRRALAGIDPGGDVSRRAGRLARGLLAAQAGQALPLVLGRAARARPLHADPRRVRRRGDRQARVQRAADLAAISAARSMRDDLTALLAPARLARRACRTRPTWRRRPTWRGRGRGGRRRRGERGRPRGACGSGFPDAGSFAPLRVRAPR